ncbi:hypothetical protein GMSM_16460 [Geomonas sp. Red276]
MENQQPPRRLCSEIQLFDLCDLDECSKKDGRYCTDPKTLERFEAIKEEDERSQYLPEEMEEEEGEDDDFGGDEYEDDEY